MINGITDGEWVYRKQNYYGLGKNVKEKTIKQIKKEYIYIQTLRETTI